MDGFDDWEEEMLQDDGPAKPRGIGGNPNPFQNPNPAFGNPNPAFGGAGNAFAQQPAPNAFAQQPAPNAFANTTTSPVKPASNMGPTSASPFGAPNPAFGGGGGNNMFPNPNENPFAASQPQDNFDSMFPNKPAANNGAFGGPATASNNGAFGAPAPAATNGAFGQPSQNNAFAPQANGNANNSPGFSMNNDELKNAMGDVMGAVGMADNPMANMALGIAGNQVGVATGVAAGWFSKLEFIKPYFAVDHDYVCRKLLFLFFPFKNVDVTEPGGLGNQLGGVTDPQAAAGQLSWKTNVQDADLYLPIMGIFTYVLVYGIYTGMHDGMEFDYGIFGTTMSTVLVIDILNTLLSVGAFFIYGATNISVVDLFAFSADKYVLLSAVVVCNLLAPYILTWLFFFYTVAACGFGHWLSLRHLKPYSSGMARELDIREVATSFLTQICLGLCVIQIFLFWFMAPSFSWEANLDVTASMKGFSKDMKQAGRQNYGD